MSFVKKTLNLLLILFFRIKYKNIKLAWSAKILPKSVFGGYNSVERNSTFYGKMGHDSYIGKDSFIYAEIGNYTSIGDNVKCVFARHPVNGFVSTSPVFFSTKKQNGHTYVHKQLYDEVMLQEDKDVPVIIGSDVWIGTGVTIVGKIRIGDGAVLAAGSVVTHDVQPFTIVGGVPSREIKKRFDHKTIERLLASKWWNRDERWIKENYFLFQDVELFLKNISNCVDIK